MNKTIRTYIILILLAFFISCEKKDTNSGYYCEESFDLLISYMNMPRPDDSYDYPIRPCMNEWKEMTSTQEKIDACAIPITILKKMSTQAVIQALWEYPFSSEPIHEIGGRNAQKDFETVFYNNNAYKELLLRKDAGIDLFTRISLVDAVCRGDNMFKPLMLELLISQSDFLTQLNNNEKKDLIKIVFEKDSIRQDAGVHGELGSYTSLMLIGRTLLNADYSPFVKEVSENNVLKLFLETSMFFVNTLEELRQEKQIIVDNGKRFVNFK